MKFNTKELLDQVVKFDGNNFGSYGILTEESHNGIECKMLVVDSTLDQQKGMSMPLMFLDDIDIVNSYNNWELKSYSSDGENCRAGFARWIDFVDNDGDGHHGRLTRYFDPGSPEVQNYVLEVDVRFERNIIHT